MGLDLSLTGTGAVVLSDGEILKFDLIRTTPKMVEEERFDIIWKRIWNLYKETKPVIVLIEAAIGGKTTQHATHGLNAVVRYGLWRHDVLFDTMYPGTLKKAATGNGRADKAQMIAAAQAFWPECNDDNLADAYHLSVEAGKIAYQEEP